MLHDYWYLPIFCAVFLLTAVLLILNYSILWVLVFLGICFFVRRKILLIILILAAVLLALMRLQMLDRRAQSIYEQIPDNPVRIKAYIHSSEKRSSYKQRLLASFPDQTNQLFDQKAYVYASLYPRIHQGRTIRLLCQFEKPEPFDGFAYDKYLISQGIYSICRGSQIEVIDDTITFFEQPLEKIRLTIRSGIESLWPGPIRSLIIGLLLGSRESFSEKTLQQFSRSGITHIIALSGFNITILILFFEAILARCLIKKQIRLITILFFITVFTILVGAGASITRAAIMGALVIIAKHLARTVSVLRIMLITAAVMTFFQPFILLYDLGFQLSFLSTLGLLLTTRWFERLFFFIPKFFSLRESLCATLGATAFTLPLILFQFQQISFVSPLANMLILPAIPLIMAISAIAVLLHYLAPFFLPPFVILADLGSRFVLDISALFSSFSWASRQLTISFLLMISLYLILFAIIGFFSYQK